jgi:hypothetical protein
VIAWYRESRRGSVVGAILFGLIIAVLITITRGVEWIGVWWVWVVVLGGMLLIYKILRADRLGAGSDWVSNGRKWVRIYELTEVNAQASGSGVFLRMRDSGGRYLELKFITVVGSDRLLWDLTYNGILYSVIAGGAKTNPLLHRTLKLPYPKPEHAGEQNNLPSED